jgi:hypothetical protein
MPHPVSHLLFNHPNLDELASDPLAHEILLLQQMHYFLAHPNNLLSTDCLAVLDPRFKLRLALQSRLVQRLNKLEFLLSPYPHRNQARHVVGHHRFWLLLAQLELQDVLRN